LMMKGSDKLKPDEWYDVINLIAPHFYVPKMTAVNWHSTLQVIALALVVISIQIQGVIMQRRSI